MKVELTKEECFNIQQSLVLTSKRPEADANAMKVLLILSDKFNWKDNPPKTAKEEEKDKK